MPTPVAHLLAAAVILLAAAPPARAQSTEFEVASIKANRTGSGGSNLPYLRNGTLTATNVSLLMLLESAYDLSAARIIGRAWLDSDRYDVAGKAPQGIPDTEMMPMLQAMLKDRFRVSVHREIKEMPVYEMVVARDGLKISPFDPEHFPTAPRNLRGGVIMGGGTMEQLAKLIAGPAGKPVVDKTGLDGRYSYVLTYTPLSAQSDNAADPELDIFQAVQQQLGLKLEAKKDPIEVLVIDHAERVPSGN